MAGEVLANHWTRDRVTTWEWRASEPMAPCLATTTIGEFDLSS